MKYLKIIIVNIFCIIFIIFFFELIAYINQTKGIKKDLIKNHMLASYSKLFFLKDEYKEQLLGFCPMFNKTNFANDLISNNSKKRPVLILGCSFARGSDLDIYNSFAGKLHKYTKRSVINRARDGFGVNQAIIYLQNGIEKEINDPEYIIYVFTNDQLYRLYMIPCPEYIAPLAYFKYNKLNKLVEKNSIDLWYFHSNFLKIIINKIIRKKQISDKQEKFLLDHFLLLNNEINEKFPKAKFVILVYTGDEIIKYIENELKGNNIEIVYLSELSNINFITPEYQLSETDMHPNAKAWETITPILVKKLGL